MDAIEHIKSADKVLIYMKSGASWHSNSANVTFTKEHPFQLVDHMEAMILLSHDRFRQGTRDDLERYYRG